MSDHIHPLVMATIEEHRARKELELERLRSAREACTTASPGGQSRAMALGKKIREVESVVAGWRLAVATLLDDELTATGPLQRSAGPDAVVAYRGVQTPVLNCIRCMNPAWQSWTSLTSADLPDGGMCAICHADVLA